MCAQGLQFFYEAGRTWENMETAGNDGFLTLHGRREHLRPGLLVSSFTCFILFYWLWMEGWSRFDRFGWHFAPSQSLPRRNWTLHHPISGIRRKESSTTRFMKNLCQIHLPKIANKSPARKLNPFLNEYYVSQGQKTQSSWPAVFWLSQGALEMESLWYNRGIYPSCRPRW